MEHSTQDDVKAQLLATSDEFRALAAEHASLEHQIEVIEQKEHVLPDDELEESRLKKLKLRLKDQMNDMLARSRTQVA
ncbi:MAG: DUF465 domain-containing protein [Bryobacteraceae bacterium]